ncbi:MAG: sugar transferase [Clostridiales bacterium]|nr:sugar transferase [Clostridiales bacterium]
MYRKEIEGWLKHYDFILFDLICLQIAFVASYALSGYGFHPYRQMLYRNMAVFLALVDVIVIFSLETFKGVLKRSDHAEFLITVRHVVVLCGLSLLYLFVLQQSGFYSRLALFLMFLIYAILTYAVRQIWKRCLGEKRKAGGERSLLIIAAPDIAESVIETIKANNYAGFTLAGAVIIDEKAGGQKAGQSDGNHTSPNTRAIAGIPIVADIDSAAMYVCREWIDEVIIVPSEGREPPSKLMGELLETGVTIHVNLATISDAPGKKQFVEKVGGYTVLTTTINCASVKQILLKRVMDVAGGIVGCGLTAVIFVFVAPVMLIQSPGPIFFTQERVGKNGKKFRIFKFRSMYQDADARKAELMKENKMSDDRMFKLDFDPRVIGNRILPDGTQKKGFGQFLRDTSLDEFPQFFNVLRGDMSLVGTRPPLVGEVSEYELHHRARLAIKPGITGLWQVRGRSDITDFKDVVRLDRQYISEWNIWLDIRILFKTVVVVLRRKGSV